MRATGNFEAAQNVDPLVALSAETRLTADKVRVAMRQLTDEQSEVLSLRFLEGYSIFEVAVMMNKTEGAIKALQSLHGFPSTWACCWTLSACTRPMPCPAVAKGKTGLLKTWHAYMRPTWWHLAAPGVWRA